MAHRYGMNTLLHRTTFALDKTAVDRLKKLSTLWQVSQAEVVRRALAMAEDSAIDAAQNPLELLNAYHNNGGLDALVAESYLADTYKDRAQWRVQ